MSAATSIRQACHSSAGAPQYVYIRVTDVTGMHTVVDTVDVPLIQILGS